MIRVAKHLLNTGIVLVSRKGTLSVASPPPKPKPKDDSILWGTMFLATLTAAFAIYAKRSPEIRDWLTIYAPWFDDFIAVLYQENMTYKEFGMQCLEDARKYVGDVFSDGKSKPCLDDVAVDKSIPTVPEKPKEVAKEISVEDEAPCKVLPPPVLTKDICEVEACLKDLYETIINNYVTAKAACVYYNQLVEETMTDFSIPKLKDLRKAMEERLDLVKVSIKNAFNAQDDMDDLTRYLDCGVQALPEAIEKTKQMMNVCRENVVAACIEFQWENDKSIVRDSQWQAVESLIDRYTEETQIMLPGLQFVQNKLQLSGDPDLLLYHTYRYAQKLKEELRDAESGMQERVDRALDTAISQGQKETQVRKALIEAGIKQRRAAMEKEFNKRAEDQKKRNECILKESLERQLKRHQESLEVKLEQREKEAMRKLNHMVAEKVASEKRSFAKQRSEMAMKLKIVEDKLNAHLKAEKETRRSQDLWTAGASLLAATKKGYPCVRVDKELKALQKASGDDKFVTTVMKAIPETVWDRGVVPESVLRENYYKMEKTALKVALVEQEGSPLPIYFLSWLQSTLLFMKLSGIPQTEIDKPPKEPSEDLDTFDLLQRARFWIERGNLAMAIRYVNSLEGASLIAAETWLEDARTHLAIRQGAEAVIAHAVALGLQYI